MVKTNRPYYSKPGYRKDIDGLRAIAVILVVLFHLKLKAASAGFLGVDIFFIISGYLITSHIYNDIILDQFSFRNFYLKRVKRLLPALVFMLAFSTATAYMLLIHEDLENYAKSLIATIKWLSNFYFWRQIKIGYFSTDASVLPLLHTWSLGVEEQFYILWPILLLLFSHFFHKKSYIQIATVTLSLISFTLYLSFSKHTGFVFYSPFTRAFELLSGCLLALNKPIAIKKKWNALIFSYIGIAIIIISACFLQPSNFPSSLILLIIFGTSLVIISNQHKQLTYSLLQLSPIVFLGRISYSLYLWHWPIIAYLNYLGIKLHAPLILLSSIAIATLSYKLIETPFRARYVFNLKKSLLIFWFIPLLCAILFLKLAKLDNNFGYNSINKTANLDIKNQYFGAIKANTNCHSDSPNILGSRKDCTIGYLPAKHTSVLITGDSHAMSYTGMLNVFLKEKKLKAFVATESSTPFLILKQKNSKFEKRVSARAKIITKLITNHNYQYAIMAADWDAPGYHFFKNKKMLYSDLKRTIQLLLKKHIEPVIMLDFPPIFNLPVACGATKVSVQACQNSIVKILSLQGQTRLLIKNLKNQFPTLIVIDPFRVICTHMICRSIIGQTPLYFTNKLNSHLNFSGSSLLGHIYLRRYGNPLP